MPSQPYIPIMPPSQACGSILVGHVPMVHTFFSEHLSHRHNCMHPSLFLQVGNHSRKPHMLISLPSASGSGTQQDMAWSCCQLVIFECKENPRYMEKLDVSELDISEPKCKYDCQARNTSVLIGMKARAPAHSSACTGTSLNIHQQSRHAYPSTTALTFTIPLKPSSPGRS